MRTFWRIISGPFKWVWYSLTFIREFILNIFLVVLIVFGIGICLHIHHSSPVVKGALLVDLTGTIVDKAAINNKFGHLGRELLGASSNHRQENSLFDIVNTIRQAKKDSNITGIVLSLKNFSGADQTSLQYIGKALREFHDTGKPIYAVGDKYSQSQYFLASYANKIYLTPQGSVDLHGIATHHLYYKTLLHNLKINSHIFRVGTYKSAVEPFLRDNMSEDAREADSRWVDQLWQHYVETVSANRKISVERFFPSAQVMLEDLRSVQGNAAQFALKYKWVDKIISRPMIDAALIKAFGINKHNKAFNAISIYDYQPTTTSSPHGGKIAVILANGAIIDGSETPGLVGGDTTADQIHHARLDPTIKAIVFRINSPGGSVTASEIIRSELAAARSAGKPIVVSMGGMAASGGYWISTPANYIIASPSTLTGSIGIFGVINTLEESLDKIGVHTDGITTSPLADVSITKTLSPEFSQMMQLKVQHGYNHFLTLVAQSLHKTPEEIDKIGQGHVWIGTDAEKNGLINQLGDFDDAVNKAAELAKLKKYQLHWYLDQPSFFELLLMQTGISINAFMPRLNPSWLPVSVTQLVNQVTMDAAIGFTWNDPQNCYAFCLYCAPMVH
ncbi:signal peptide peptidase SppA [Candidatus Steffania adelgidicola]|uniref:signal peptide peptidase SppA n=1 Tax=Candidatus Steffania adelgidicola TaxID=1076626 RepID=UPI001D00D69E|nr:signal peptide peptidase SppA [Candidatus Steffania adelgidicola]UDG79579.1 Protease 4 [Candidatus Steffania adelgidicola]